MWRYQGQERPPFADSPAAGQESVWDYPRPPALDRSGRHVRVTLGRRLIADSVRTLRVLETASPPTVYIPPDDIRTDWLEPAGGVSVCEWKGTARYWSVVIDGRRVERCGWSYPEPRDAFAALAGHVCFYPSLLECWSDGERVRPQGGGFYGGWVTDEIAGPWKGGPGSGGW